MEKRRDREKKVASSSELLSGTGALAVWMAAFNPLNAISLYTSAADQ